MIIRELATVGKDIIQEVSNKSFLIKDDDYFKFSLSSTELDDIEKSN